MVVHPWGMVLSYYLWLSPPSWPRPSPFHYLLVLTTAAVSSDAYLKPSPSSYSGYFPLIPGLSISWSLCNCSRGHSFKVASTKVPLPGLLGRQATLLLVWWSVLRAAPSCSPFSYQSLAKSFLFNSFFLQHCQIPKQSAWSSYPSPCRPLPSSVVAQVMVGSDMVCAGKPPSYCCLLPPADHSCTRRFLEVAKKPRWPDRARVCPQIKQVDKNNCVHMVWRKSPRSWHCPHDFYLW